MDESTENPARQDTVTGCLLKLFTFLFAAALFLIFFLGILVGIVLAGS